MAPRNEPPVSWATDFPLTPSTYTGFPRNIKSINELHWDESLQPHKYEIFGTHPESMILFLDVNIVDSTGTNPYRGDVLIVGERISAVGIVPDVETLKKDPKTRVFYGNGRTLMSGLGDAHTHFTWNGSDLDRLGDIPVEEHVLLTMRSAECYLDSGFTMCFGAAAAKERLDVVIRNAINAGDIPGPRYLANGKEIARRDGELVASITAFADGPEEMRAVIRRNIEIGVDNVKLSMSGEEITETRSAQDCYYTDEETAACVDEAHKHGKRLCSHARARDSVKMSIKHGIEAVFHASYIDDEGMGMLEDAKSKHVIVPALNWLVATLNEAEAFGYTHAAAEKAGYKQELDAAIAGLREMHRRGIVVLPGGDYGFAWTPHGTYARDLEHFVNLLDFTPHEALIAATAGVSALMMRSEDLGKIQPGFYADCILVDGDPIKDITILQDHSKLNVICINGRIHKAGRREYHASGDIGVPDVRREMQKQY
ncbi:isoaspartyl dipeptidase-like protein [Xylariaceae sp. FL0255]|nr:isoaspartyl dipeptidase-like protein [Xylariaceae sp. FL0255]